MSSIDPNRPLPPQPVKPLRPAAPAAGTAVAAPAAAPEPAPPAEEPYPNLANGLTLRPGLSSAAGPAPNYGLNALTAALDRQWSSLQTDSGSFQDYVRQVQGQADRVRVNMAAPTGRPAGEALLGAAAGARELIQGLKRGDAQAFEALQALDPASFGEQELQSLLELTASQGQGAQEAFCLLQDLALDHPQAAAKFGALAKRSESNPVALKLLFKAAENNAVLFQQLLYKAPISAASALTIASGYLAHSNPHFREPALEAIRSTLAGEDQALADTAGRLVLDQLRLDPKDATAFRLVEAAYERLDRGRPEAGDLNRIQAFVARNSPQGLSVKHQIKWLGLLTRAVTQQVAGAPEALLKAMQSDKTALAAFKAFEATDIEVARALVPLVKSLPQSSDLLSPVAQVRKKLGPRLSGNKVQEVSKLQSRHFQEALQKAFATDDDELDDAGLKLKQLAKLLQARQILDKPPKDVDPADYDHQALERDIARLVEDKDIKAALAAARDQALSEVFGKEQPLQAPYDLRNYLMSEDFKHHLELLPPKQRQRVLDQEIQKLSALDPRLGLEVAQKLSLRQLSEQALPKLAKLPPAQAQASLEAAMRHELSQRGEQLPPGALRELARQTQAAIGIAARQGISIEAALEQSLAGQDPALKALAQKHLLSDPRAFQRILGLASAASVAMTLPEYKDDLSAALKVFSYAGTGVGLAQYLGYHETLFKSLGLAGSVLGAAAETIGLIEAIKSGDGERIAMACAKTSGGVLATVNGILNLAGKGVPLLTVLSLAITFGTMLYDAIWGDTPEKDFLDTLDYER